MANSNDLQNELNVLKEDIAKLRADVADLGITLKDVAAEKVRNAKGRLEEGAEDATAALRDRLDEARRKGREVLDGLEEHVSGHPVGSMATAFGAGFVIASLFHWGSRN